MTDIHHDTVYYHDKGVDLYEVVERVQGREGVTKWECMKLDMREER